MKQYYSKQAFGSLFLMYVFPLHLWTLLLAFRDISWVAERTNFGDAIGVVSYGMVFAFLESLLIFVLSLWAMTSQLYGLQAWNNPNTITTLAAGSTHPPRSTLKQTTGMLQTHHYPGYYDEAGADGKLVQLFDIKSDPKSR
jgi:hypothetical protein